MKKFISIAIALIICISQVNLVLAENNYSVENTTIKENDEFLDINVSIPDFKGFKAADKINESIKSITEEYISATKETANSLKEFETEESVDWKSTLIINYDYFLNQDILSIQLNAYTFSGGAHGMSYVIPITMNISTGEVYEFKDLFKEESSVKKVEDILIQTIDKNPESYFEEYHQTIKEKNGHFNFYIDGDKVIVYFDLYDIAPYASGINRFVFEANNIKNILKDEVYNSIKDTKSFEKILFNGANFSSEEIILNNDLYMVPLRSVANVLGHEVSWNKEDGITLNGKSISDTNLVIENNLAYVPLEYFTQTLGENISIGNLPYINTFNSDYEILNNIVIRVFDNATI